MLTEQEGLEKIKAIRHPSEPEEVPTENGESVDLLSEDEPEDDYHIDDQPPEEASIEQEEPQENDEDLFYVDLDGEEITSAQIREWKSGHMMQSDYTRKTQEVSEKNKAIEEKINSIDSEYEKLNKQIATLEAITSSSKLSDDEISEMREYEPEKYIEYMEKQSAISKALSEAKANTKTNSNVDTQEESSKLFANNPHWLENGKPTKAFEEDKALITEYATSIGYSNDELGSIDRAHHYQTLLDAARYKAMSKKNASVEKKVRKAPKATRPRSSAQSTGARADYEKAQANFKANPTDRNAVELRKAKRKLNN